MIDRANIGATTGEKRITVEHYPLRFFAEAVGERSPIHNDRDAARSRGFLSIVAPPTYALCLETMATSNELIHRLGIDLRQMLHGEQAFDYHRPVVEGDELLLTSRVEDIYEKKNGALEFVVIRTEITDTGHVPVASLTSTLIVRH